MYSDVVWSGSIRISEVLLYLVVFLAIFHIARLMVQFPT